MKSRKILHYSFLIILFFFSSFPLHAAPSKDKSSQAKTSPNDPLIPSGPDAGYTINFDNVPVLELIKFISKIGNINFVYEQQDLNFDVTILSEEPTGLVHIMAAFTQFLRGKGLDLTEQGNTVVISRGTGARQIATVVSKESPLEGDFIPPIMTRVFRVKNANPATLAGLIGPLLSSNAIIEVSETTRHIIITDITQNIEEIHKLFDSLDIPKSSLEIDSYHTKNSSPENLITLANQLLIPISEGNPLIFVPQPSTNTIFIVTTPFLIEKSIATLEDLDAPPMLSRNIQGPLSSDNILIYHIKNKPDDVLQSAINDIGKNLEKMGSSAQNLVQAINSMKFVKESHSLLFTGDAQSLTEVKSILASLDISDSEEEIEYTRGGFYIYKIENADQEHIARALEKLTKNLKSAPYPDKELIDTIRSMKWIKENNSLLFMGDQRSLSRLKQMMPTFDVAISARNDFFIYSPKHVTAQTLLKQVDETHTNLKNANLSDPALLNTLNSVEISSDQGTITFTGDSESLDKIRALLTTLDKSNEEISTYVYQLQFVDPTMLEGALQKIEKSIRSDEDLREIIDNMKYISQSNSLIFEGSTDGLEQIKKILPTLDNAAVAEEAKPTYFVYVLQNAQGDLVLEYLNETADSIESSGGDDEALVQSIRNIKWIQSSNSLIITGPSHAIDRIKVTIGKYDVSHSGKNSHASEYYIFKPRHQSPDAIITQSNHTADEMKDSGLKDPNLITALNSASVVSKGTGVLFTGTEDAINRIKEIVPSFDISISSPEANEFYVYKPIHVSPDALRKHAQTVAKDMEASGFVDKDLINTLNNTRLVSNGKAVLFTGTDPSIVKVKGLLPSLDIPSGEKVKQVGKTTFVIYKIKYLTGPVLTGYLRNMTADLKKTGSTQKDLISTLDHMRYVQDTNSIIFTGTPVAVQEAVELAQKFDIPGHVKKAPARAPSGYLIYKPEFVPGEELIKILQDFEQNLTTSGVTDQALFDVINNLKWMDKTSSILVSGDEEHTKKVYDLLIRFDVSSLQPPKITPRVETISDMNFLVYKLEYHSGSEIQDAIKLIGTDLGKSKTKMNDHLVDAINTLQWIEVTNSLIATGEPNALKKLKELIQNIDIPLKQVFVEILVIRTTISNNLQFGLRWGSQGNYRGKFAYGTGSFPSTIGGVSDPLGAFQSNLSNITATNTPKGSFIPFTAGGDLGVIGDIILHKGQSYFALGSLINAIKDEGDSVVVMNQKIITQDNKMSTIFVGQNIPYTGSFVTNQSQNTTTTANLEYRDVGVSLSITPVVGNGDVITLMIEEDISEQLNEDSTTTTTNELQVQGITTNKSSTKTVVSVPDKSFLVISGSMQDSKVYHKTGIPCLGGLPLVGAAFSNTEKAQNIGNLLIFVRPHIIKSFDTYKEITERQEDLYRSQTKAEDFDAGLELVKTPDDTY